MATIKTFGPVDARALAQLERCAETAEYGVLCADHHVGYSQPIGGAVAYEHHISPSGVGYDIGCGNKAVRTSLTFDMHSALPLARVVDEIARRISFGVGRVNDEPVDHPVIDAIAHADFAPQRGLVDLARTQLGTVGSGNHYVDLFTDESSHVWVGVHFGSRGFGHKTATGFLALAQGKQWGDKASEGSMDAPPVLLDTRTPLGQDYIEAMKTAGAYAYAGRDLVVAKVLDILGVEAEEEVHNHHNFAWDEEHFGRHYWVVRKGCTPARPGQRGFVGGSMGDVSVILEGVDSPDSAASLYSTVHGAGRVMSRTEAAGKTKWLPDPVTGKKRPRRVTTGRVDWDAVRRELAGRGIVVRGGGADEAPEVYKRLPVVLGYHGDTIRILHTLTPIGVVMAGADTFDPYAD